MIKEIKKTIKQKGKKETARLAFELVCRKLKSPKIKKQLKPLTKELKAVLDCNDEIKYELVLEKSKPIAQVLTKNRDIILGNEKFVVEARNLLYKAEKEKKYRNYIREQYIKVIVPVEYDKRRKDALENKVVFLESGKSPSPSSYLLSKEIEKQKKYQVVYCGLGVRTIPNIEYYENAVRFIEEAATAKAIFLSTANDILSQFDLRPETKLIQLWHGVGMFKKCGWSTVDNNNFGRNEDDRNEYNQYRNYYAVTIAGDEQAWTFKDAMRLEDDKIRPIGIARTDVFYDEDYIRYGREKLYREYPQTVGKKIILYAPTFRGKVGKATAPDQLDIKTLADALSDEYILIIKHHGLAKKVPEVPEEYKDKFAFEFSKNKFLSIEKLLSIADICITDYSSIGFEYAIMERPMIFFAYDIDDYLDQRGMYYDYDKITPGPVVKTTEEIAHYIKHLDELYDPNVVKEFKNKYVHACDGHAVERTMALLEE